MKFVCLWSPRWSTGATPSAERAAELLALAPRVVLDARGVVWADARGLDGVRLARALVARAQRWHNDAGVHAGVASVPIVAELAARAGGPGVTVVPTGRERDYLAPLPLAWLASGEPLLELLDGVGIHTCGALAALEPEAVEVRFGAEGVRLWRLARADDERRLFGPIPAERPHASLDFIDYVLTDPARLVFTANALLGGICETLVARGAHARALTLSLALANGARWQRTLRPARPTASRAAWLRMLRAELERLSVPDAVAGVSLWVDATEPAAVRQGDLFDRGFATASAVEAAVARLIELHGHVVVEPAVGREPRPERRARWMSQTGTREPRDAGTGGHGDAATGRHGDAETRRRGDRRFPASPCPRVPASDEGWGGEARLSLQLLPEPRRVIVDTIERCDYHVPVRFADGDGWQELVTAAGPDCISGGAWEEAYAREYYRCVTVSGIMLWLYCDAQRDEWYLHGWWD